MSRSEFAQQRERDLLALSHGLSVSMPPLHGGHASYVVVVEGRQEFLAEALPYVPLLSDVAVQTAAVGVAASLGSNMEHVLCGGPGTDIHKMWQVAQWIAEGRLGGNILLFVEPHRAALLNGLLRKQLRVQQIICRTQAMDLPQAHVVNLEVAIEHARQLIEAIDAGHIHPVAEFAPGSELRLAYERLTS